MLAAGSFETHTKVICCGVVQQCGLSSTPRMQQGTSVTVTGLFGQMPVRQRAMLEGSRLQAEGVRDRLFSLLLPRPDVEMRLVDDVTGSTLLYLRTASEPRVPAAISCLRQELPVHDQPSVGHPQYPPYRRHARAPL